MITNNSENNELQQCMAKGIIACRLRKRLTRFGIPENEQVTVAFKYGDKVLASCEIEASSSNGQKVAQMSLEAFDQEIIDEFIMPTEVLFDLSGAIPGLDNTRGETNNFSLEFDFANRSNRIRTCFKRFCNNCPNGLECCWKRVPC